MADIDVPPHCIRDRGGWAPGSTTLEKTYIHHACRPSAALYAFFGHLHAPTGALAS